MGRWVGADRPAIRYLEGLTHLKSLTLWGTDDPPLTDASLASISKLTGLEELYFVRIATKFTSRRNRTPEEPEESEEGGLRAVDHR